MLKRLRYGLYDKHLIGSFENWGWQDFPVPIGPGPLVIDCNTNGTCGDFESDCVLDNTAVIVIAEKPEKRAYTGIIRLFGSVVSADNAGAIVYLSGTPHPRWGPCRIYYHYCYKYGKAPDFRELSQSVLGALNN